MSATLLLEGITVLLAIPVARNTGNGTSGWGVVAILVLAFALIAACAFVRKPYATAMIIVLQVLDPAGLVHQPSARHRRGDLRPGLADDLLPARGIPAAGGGRYAAQGRLTGLPAVRHGPHRAALRERPSPSRGVTPSCPNAPSS